MHSRLWLWLPLLPVLAVLSLPLGAQEGPAAITWKKTVVDRTFRSEGVAIADVNKDGKMDVLAGEVWYAAPDWKMQAFRKPPRDYGNGLQGYSESFACWTDDFNGDGWADVLVIRFPGAPCYWYENPQGQPGLWKEHLVWDNACNETPLYVDLFGNGKRVLVMGVQPKGRGNDNLGQMGWFRPGKDPTQPWEMHPISEPSDVAAKKIIPGTFKFSHGLGVGDLNGDGRSDVVCTGGWWAQPEKDDGKPWTFHAANIGDACADMIVHDMDGDGKADIVSSSAHKFGIWWHQQRSPNAFVKNDLFPQYLSETHAMHFVDINGDGRKDLVTGKRWWSHGRAEPGSDWPAMLYWFESSKDKNGMTRFSPRVIDIDSGVGTQFVVDDFNGDKLPDVVVSNKKGVYIFEQIGSEKSRIRR